MAQLVLELWLWISFGYFRFSLSFREVEELMLARRVVLSYETVRRWCAKFGQAYAKPAAPTSPSPG